MNSSNRSKNIRLKDYDYHSGCFFVTNKTNFARQYFKGELRDLIKTELMNLVRNTQGVGLDYFHIMPNHAHVILVFDKAKLTLSEFWRRYKAITSYKAKKIGLIDSSLWQKNFFEHIVRNERALENIREYIMNNPLKENLPLEEIYSEVNIETQ